MSKTRKNKQRRKIKKNTRKIGNSVKELNSSIKNLVKKITGKPFRGTVGVVSKYALNTSTPYLGKIPIAGNTIVYLFKKGNKGLYIVLTTADNMVDSGGNIVTSVMDGATDLTVLVLNPGKK